MTRYLLRGVLPALAAASVVLILLILALGIVTFGLSIAASMEFDTLGKAVKVTFIAFLFVFATGIVPCIVFKRLHIRNLLAYLLTGAVCGVLAEYCYLFNDEFWFSWDFSAPSFAGVLKCAIQDMPALLAGIVPMLPWSAIPVAVGLLGSGLYWMHARRRLVHNTGTDGVDNAKENSMLHALRQTVLATLAVCGTYAIMLVVLAGLIELDLFLHIAGKAGGTAKSLGLMVSWSIPALVLIVLIGIVPSITLHAVRVRAIGAYLLAGIASGLLAAYFWLFSFVVSENLSGWVFVPTGSTGDGYTRAPSFFHLLQHVFASLPEIFVSDMVRMWKYTLVWSVIGAVCGGLYWLVLGHRTGRTQ